MLDLIEPLLKKRGLRFVRLDGSVPQKLRQELVHDFQTNPDCRVFLTTNAGSTGLNLQAANTVINVDLPWNPAVLEQRIARAYRMGQEQPVQVFVLITEETIEEKLLSTLSAKHDLALAALDADSDVDQVDLAGGIEELRRRLEVLLGARPEAASDESVRRETELGVARVAAERNSRRERLAVSGGHLLTAAFRFLGELLPPPSGSSEPNAPTNALAATLKQSLTDLVEQDDHGRPLLTFALPDTAALDDVRLIFSRACSHKLSPHRRLPLKSPLLKSSKVRPCIAIQRRRENSRKWWYTEMNGWPMRHCLRWIVAHKPIAVR